MNNMKRKMAAALCAVMLLGQAVPAVPALHRAAYAEGEQTEKVFSGASASGSKASSETASDGSISGSASFTGSRVVAKLYKGGSNVGEKTLPDGGGSFTFSGLSAGDYVVKYFFWGEGGNVLEQNGVTVGYDVVEPEETETPKPEETETPAPEETETPGPEETETPAPDETETPDPDETETPAPVNTQGSSGGENSGQDEVQQTFKVTASKPASVITDYTCVKANETEIGKNDGSIGGKVEFTGGRAVVKLHDGQGAWMTEAVLSTSGESYTFSNLAPGTYKVAFHMYGEKATETETVEIKAGPVPPQITSYTCEGKNETEADKEDGAIYGSVNFKGELAVVVKLYEEGSSSSKKEVTITSTGGSYQFSDLPAGKYSVAFRLYGYDVFRTETVTIAKGVVPNKITDYTCLKTDETAAGAGNGTISGTVTFLGDTPVKVKLGTYAEDTVENSGETYRFSGLPAGTYQVSFHIAGQEASATQTVEIGTAKAESAGQITNYTCEKTDETEAGKNNGVISGVVEFTGGRVVVKLYEDGSSASKEEAELSSSGETYMFSGLSAGTYQVAFHMYHQSAADVKTITIGTAPAQAKISDIVCLKTDVTKAGEADGTITGSVTFTGSDSVVVKLYEEGGTTSKEEIVLRSSGESYAFSKLPAGKYRVDFHLYGQSASDTKNMEIGVAAPAIAPVSITSVEGGEKTLTVRGTAQAGAQILVQAEPAGAKAEVLVVGADGKFATNLSAAPGTYTKVSVQYVADASSVDYESGSWTVKEPAAEPTITVDPIDNHSTTVVVKTGANLAVTLKTPDNTMTIESNADGLAHFSLTHKYLKGEEFIISVVYGSGSGKTVTKKVTVEGVTEYRDLEYGDYGEAVLRLTTRLNQLGYPIAPTKDYNSAVREAVRLFQLANGQEADGEAGDTMQSALYSVSAIRYGSGRYPTLVRGDKGLALIKTLQQRLKDLGYYTIKVDGIFGSGTQRAVRLFQSVNGLRETGIADNATQVLLYSSAAKPIGYGYTGDYSTLQRSSKYKSAVVTLQRRLRELGYYSGSIDGYFGSKTYRAVRNFQSRNGLKVNGIADAQTQQLLYSSAAKKYNGSSSSSSSSSSVGYRLLYWGCRGEEVKRLQNALISAGYKKYVRSADGIYGQWTYDAVCAYQRDHGLSVDGIAGKKTQNKLFGTNY